MYGHRLLKSVLVLVGIQSITDPVQTSPCCDHLENFNILSYRRFSTYWTVLVDIGPENRQKNKLFEHHKSLKIKKSVTQIRQLIWDSLGFQLPASL
jgi:hypothetical protein